MFRSYVRHPRPQRQPLDEGYRRETGKSTPPETRCSRTREQGRRIRLPRSRSARRTSEPRRHRGTVTSGDISRAGHRSVHRRPDRRIDGRHSARRPRPGAAAHHAPSRTRPWGPHRPGTPSRCSRRRARSWPCGAWTSLRDKTQWKMLYESAARADEALCLNVEDLCPQDKRGKIPAKGGATEWIHWQSGTAQLPPCLIARRTRGPLFLTGRKAAAKTATLDVCSETGRTRLSCRRVEEIFEENTHLQANPIAALVRPPGSGEHAGGHVPWCGTAAGSCSLTRVVSNLSRCPSRQVVMAWTVARAPGQEAVREEGAPWTVCSPTANGRCGCGTSQPYHLTLREERPPTTET
jgi:hypothetical protein